MMYEIYALICWYVFGVFAFLSLYKHDWALLRCVAVMAAGQGIVDIWAAWFMPVVWAGQPSLLLLGVYMASAWALSIRPSGKLCSIMAALCLWGVAFSAMHHVFDWTKATDSLYFNMNLAIGWLSFFVMAGGATGERGRRFLSRLVRSSSGVANPTNKEGLA